MSKLTVKTVKLPRPVAAALERAARERGCTESELIREGIAAVTAVDAGIDMTQALGGDVGVGSGPRDLSSNRRRMARYGRSRRR